MRADPALTWYALAVNATREIDVAKDLKDTALDILVPMERNWFQVSWRVRRMELVERPLITGYIFAGCSGLFPFHALDATRAYCEPIRMPGRHNLACVPAHQIQEVIDLAKQIMPVQPISKLAFQTGMNVQFADGPFAGHQAIVAEVLKEKVEILHKFLGATRKVTVNARELKIVPQETLAVNTNIA